MATREQIDRARDLIIRIAAGRGLLLIGQRHTPGLADRLGGDAAAALSLPPAGSLPEQMAAVGDPELLPGLRPVYEQAVPDEGLNALTENPWAMVLSSAIDPAPLQSFLQMGGASRRTQVLYPEQFATLSRSVPAVPTFVRLFGSVDEVDARFLPPLNQGALRMARMFSTPAVLRDLPRLVGPGGILCVVGIGEDDWIPFETLAMAAQSLGPGSIHWFQPSDRPIPEDRIKQELGERCTFWTEDFKTAINYASSQPEWRSLNEARTAVLSPSDRVVTIKSRDDSIQPIRITAAEWRGISRVAVLLDDSILESGNGRSDAEDWLAFRHFLRSAQKVPDWRGIAQGFLFERARASELLENVEEGLTSLGRGHSSRGSSSVATRSTNLPILVEGAPGTGKTRLLHWLAFELKRRNHAVMYVVTASGRIHYESVARACQLMEAKGAPAVAVIADGLERAEYTQLNEFLASVGRRTLLLGSVTRADGVGDEPRRARGEPSPVDDFRSLWLPPNLTEDEAERFTAYLRNRGFDPSGLPRELVRERYFLLLLHRLLPETRANIQAAIAMEYEALFRKLSEASTIVASERPPERWKQQLQEIGEQLFGELALPDSEAPPSPFRRSPTLQSAVHLALFCSQIDRPIPLDLLVRAAGDDLVKSYALFSEALSKTALLQEVAVDAEGTTALTAQHSFLAQLALRNVLPDRPQQLRLLAPLVAQIGWDPDAYPGENPDQDYVVGIFKAVGPRGPAERDFEGSETRQVLVELLRSVRETHGSPISSLMLLEANTLRLLADRSDATIEERLQRCDEALRILGQSEDLVSSRRPTPARNAELANIYTTQAAVYGYQLNTLVDEAKNAMTPESRDKIFDALTHAREYTSRSRSIGPGSYYPIDIAFWAHRDILTRLGDSLTEEDRVSLLAQMDAVLSMVSEEAIEESQVSRFETRQVEMAELRQDYEVSEALAERMRQKGNYAGVCLILRDTAFDPSGILVSGTAALEALDRLERYGPSAFASDESTRLMHRLWTAAHLPRTTLTEEAPILATCTSGEWVRWRRILDARLRFPGSEFNPYLRFCHAWTLLQLGEYRSATDELREMEPLTTGNRRRVGALAVVTQEDGTPQMFRGIVRRKDPDATIAYSATLQAEILFSRFYRFEGGAPRIGEELEFSLGLNYRSLTPWRGGSEDSTRGLRSRRDGR
jgi:hypothetical protein